MSEDNMQQFVAEHQNGLSVIVNRARPWETGYPLAWLCREQGRHIVIQDRQEWDALMVLIGKADKVIRLAEAST